jgi:hypothetical protein
MRLPNLWINSASHYGKTLDRSHGEIRDLFLNLTGKNVVKEFLTFVKSASTKRSNLSTVPSLRQRARTESLLHNQRITKDQKADGFIRRFCLFLLRCFFVIILSWLIIIFFPKNNPNN